MKQMTLEQFTKYIEKIRLYYEVDKEVNSALNKLNDDFYNFSSSYSVITIVELLNFIFEDESDWLGYWLWELDFGKKYNEGSVTLDGKNISLKTIEDLYNMLIDNMKNGDIKLKKIE